MKHLIVYAHPNPKSLNGFLKNSLETHLRQNGHETMVRDLYLLKFDPVLSLDDMAGQRIGKVAMEVQREQDFIRWADCITFIYPIWWTGLPAMVKGFIDRVFSYGFAYRYDQGIQKGLLKGKRVMIINTHGKSNAEYELIGMNMALALTSDTGIFNYSGLAIGEHFFLDKADRAVPEAVSHWMERITAAYDKPEALINVVGQSEQI